MDIRSVMRNAIILAIIFHALPFSAQYFGAQYITDASGDTASYYCLTRGDGKVYKVLGMPMKEAKDSPYGWAMPNGITWVVEYDLESRVMLYLQYMHGADNAVGVFEDTISQYFHGVDGTEIKMYVEDGALDSCVITRHQSWHKYFEILDTTLQDVGLTLLFGDTTLPAIHPVNIEYPEVRYLPHVVKRDNKTWHLNEVFYNPERIDGLLSILYSDGYRPITESDVDAWLEQMGVTREEWWELVKKEAEKRKRDK